MRVLGQNQISDVEQSNAQFENVYNGQQTYITLKPYIRFLEFEGYNVSLVDTGAEGVSLLQEETYHAVLLHYDAPTQKENLLSRVRSVNAHIPIILLTA